MTTIQVAFPVLRGRRRFHVEKGRRWSLVEHLMLDAVARKPTSAAELSEKSKLPRRIVVEAFIRLMRVGWVEIVGSSEAGPIFDVTAPGRAQAGVNELPAATVNQPRWMGFIIDQVAGSVFRGRELSARHRNAVSKSPGSSALVFLDRSGHHFEDDLAEIFAAMEGDDEVIVNVDDDPGKLTERYAVVTVTDGAIEGLPARASPTLRAAILAKAKAAAEAAAGTPGVDKAPLTAEVVLPSRRPCEPALFDQGDLILDGQAHRAALELALRHAREQVIVHSTFISEEAVRAALPMLLGAAAGTKIHILWGQEDEKTSTSSSRRAAEILQRLVGDAGRAEDIIVHRFTTRSHAKLLIADDGQGRWSAMVGSCNWLASPFDSFEASVKLREPALVGECICHVAALSLGSPGVWHNFAIALTTLGRRVQGIPRGSGRTAPLQLLLSPDHGALVLEARDQAKRRIVVTSHRIGIAGRPMVVIPTLAAAKAGNVQAQLYYGRPTGVFSGVDAAGLAAEFARHGVAITPIHRPRLHAKVLAWDDDALAVTSQNWLSADPVEGALRREIGVFIESNKVADYFLRRFEQLRAVR